VQYATTLDGVDPKAYEMLLIASDRDLESTHPAHVDNAVVYRPKSLVVGLGCDRGATFAMVERGLRHVLSTQGLSPKCIKAFATIDKKADEEALLALAAKYEVPLRIYTAEELDAVPGIVSPSAMVQKHVGTRGVSEPAALLAAGASELVVPKTIYTEEGAGRSMTVAVARVPFDKRSEQRSEQRTEKEKAS
jgi:cobalt-precorrin 5A hydrolase